MFNVNSSATAFIGNTSKTVIVNVLSALFPEVSFAVAVTTVVPTPKTLPDGKL